MPPPPPEALAAAASILGARGVEPVDDLTTSGRAIVARLGVRGGSVDTAILKLGGDHVMANWCGLTFLDRVAPGAGPRPLGGDPRRGIVLMEDLGAGPSLASALAGADGDAAEAALIAHASSLGDLGARTRGRRDEYARLVRELGGSEEDLLAPSPSARMVADAWAAAERELSGLGLRRPPGLDADLETVLALWSASPAALSFSPGDTCPDNHVVVGGAVRFFDVDFCSFHPTALDAAYHAHPHFPTCNYLGELPPAVAARARAAYAGRVDVGEGDMLAASAAWTLWNTGYILPRYPVEDRALGPITLHGMLLWRLRATAERCREAAALSRLGGLLAELAGVLAERWPDAGTMPLYPAFR